ncbi:MAG TPA: head-tail connector protein [Alphaproteobacteria bacterium]|nr:head-tail connector protein [Alphaproteobacteria bacterium]
MTAFKLTVPPSVEPVLLADAKTQARIDTTADDAFITDLITAARQWAEQYTGRAFITQTWQYWLDLWPAATELWWDGVREGPVSGLEQISYLSLPRAPLQSVNSVQYFDNTDAATVWPSSNYFVDTIREPGRLALRSGATWPVPSRLTNGIMVEYIAGYGNDGTAVPEVIKTAIRQLVSHWYEHRGEAATAVTTRGAAMPALYSINVPLVIQALLNPYRIRNSGI